MSSRRVSGFTLIEMVIAIVIISVGLAGVLLAFTTAVKSSADPLIHKQMLAIAEEMMEEILLKPYVAPAGITGTGTISGCNRAGAVELSDYVNYTNRQVCDIDGGDVGLSGYTVSVTVTSGTWQGIADTLTINVTVSHDGTAESMSLNGWRTRYALP